MKPYEERRGSAAQEFKTDEFIRGSLVSESTEPQPHQMELAALEDNGSILIWGRGKDGNKIPTRLQPEDQLRMVALFFRRWIREDKIDKLAKGLSASELASYLVKLVPTNQYESVLILTEELISDPDTIEIPEELRPFFDHSVLQLNRVSAGKLGMWALSFPEAIDTTLSFVEQEEAIVETARLTKCNNTFAQYFDELPTSIEGELARDIFGVREDFVDMVKLLVSNAYELKLMEGYCIDGRDRVRQQFASAKGKIDHKVVPAIWGMNRVAFDPPGGIRGLGFLL